MELFKQNEVIRALCLHQPYAELMLHGKIETRMRKTNVRGKVLICATRTLYRPEEIVQLAGGTIALSIAEILEKNSSEAIPIGCALGIADLVGCRPMEPADATEAFIRWHWRRYCWIFENVQPIQPFYYKGHQGWRIIPPEVRAQIKPLPGTA